MAPSDLGLKAGLEVHQQLDTRAKLFCRCPTRPRDPSERTVEFQRVLRPTAGEAGKVDVAALEESRRARRFRYLGYDTVCLVEYDEEPPRELNPDALEVALQVALLLGMEPVEEVHIMRKAVIDGSNTTGFQRTALVATGGSVETPSGRVRLTALCLEEDAAAIVGQEGDTAVYSLDRLGVPLVEIATEADIRSPAQAREAARAIGMVLRSTGKVKRGLGSVRQDVNVSIAGGARVEIKGVQELRLVERTVAVEAERQAHLLELQKAQADLGFILKLKSAKSNRQVTFAELRESLHSHIALDGPVLHLTGWGPWSSVVTRDFEAIAARYQCQATAQQMGADLALRVGGTRFKEALSLLANRALLLLTQVPEETRRALEDGSTEYLRPLPGAARMYPETDVRPVPLTATLLERLRRSLPELLESKQRRLMERYGLNEELAAAALERAGLFEAWAATAAPASSTQVVRALGALDKLEPLLQREPGLRSKILSARAFPEAVAAVAGAAEPLRARAGAEWAQKFEPAWAEFERLLPFFRAGSGDEAQAVVECIVREKAALVREKGEGAHGPLMGLAMKELRGKADGALVARLLRESITALLKGT